MVAQTLGTGVSQRGNTTSTKGILRTLFPSQHHRGDGGGDDPPEPDRRDTGKHKEGGSGGGGGGDDPDPIGGGGGRGGRPNLAGSGHVANPGALSDKMIGKEPENFHWRQRQSGGIHDQLERLPRDQQANSGDE